MNVDMAVSPDMLVGNAIGGCTSPESLLESPSSISLVSFSLHHRQLKFYFFCVSLPF